MYTTLLQFLMVEHAMVLKQKLIFGKASVQVLSPRPSVEPIKILFFACFMLRT